MKRNWLFCKLCDMYYKPAEIYYRGDDSKAEYVCPKCGHRVMFYADEETIKSFWNSRNV